MGKHNKTKTNHTNISLEVNLYATTLKFINVCIDLGWGSSNPKSCN